MTALPATRDSLADAPADPNGAGVVNPGEVTDTDRVTLSVRVASRSAERALRGLVLVVVPAVAAPLLASALATGSPWPLPLVAGCAGSLVFGYATFWVTRRAGVLLGVLVATLALLSCAMPVAVPLTVYSLWTGWLNLTCIVLGALVRSARVALLAGCGVVLGAVALVTWQLSAQGQAVARMELVAVATGALVDLLAVASGALVLRRTALRSDSSSARASVALDQVVRAQATADELRRVARLMHDSVINTLAAVARWAPADPAAVRARCAQDLIVLETVGSRSGRDPDRLLSMLEDRGRLLGLQVVVRIAHLGPPLDPGTGAALVGAGVEALNNVAKHAKGSCAVLSWSWDGSHGLLTVADSGPGFDATQGWSGGAAQSVAARSAEAGVTAVVTSSDEGTTVGLSWTGQPSADVPAALPAQQAAEVDGELTALMGEMVVRITAVFAGFGLLCATSMPPGWPRIGTVLGVGVVAAVGLLGARVQSGALTPTRIPWVTYPAASVLASALPGIGMSGCLRVGLFWWGGLAGVAVAAGAVLLDRRGWVVLATMVAFVGGNASALRQVGEVGSGCVADGWSTVATNLAVILALWVFGRQLHRLWAMGREEQLRAAAALARAARYEEQARVRADLLGFARSVFEPLLTQIADGRMDPGDPLVRARCGQTESTLRSLSAAALVETASVSALFVNLIRECHPMDVTPILKGNPSAIPEQATAELGLRLAVLPGCAQEGSPLVVTVLGGGERSLLVVCLVERPSATAVETLRDGGWDCSFHAGQLLAEATLVTGDVTTEGQPGVLQVSS